MDLELRHLRAFVAVAEELNCTREAERLHVIARRADDDRPLVRAFVETAVETLGV